MDCELKPISSHDERTLFQCIHCKRTLMGFSNHVGKLKRRCMSTIKKNRVVFLKPQFIKSTRTKVSPFQIYYLSDDSLREVSNYEVVNESSAFGSTFKWVVELIGIKEKKGCNCAQAKGFLDEVSLWFIFKHSTIISKLIHNSAKQHYNSKVPRFLFHTLIILIIGYLECQNIYASLKRQFVGFYEAVRYAMKRK